MGIERLILKGHCHEILDPRFFPWKHPCICDGITECKTFFASENLSYLSVFEAEFKKSVARESGDIDWWRKKTEVENLLALSLLGVDYKKTKFALVKKCNWKVISQKRKNLGLDYPLCTF
jgi:hypothetical protein